MESYQKSKPMSFIAFAIVTTTSKFCKAKHLANIHKGGHKPGSQSVIFIIQKAHLSLRIGLSYLKSKTCHLELWPHKL